MIVLIILIMVCFFLLATIGMGITWLIVRSDLFEYLFWLFYALTVIFDIVLLAVN